MKEVKEEKVVVEAADGRGLGKVGRLGVGGLDGERGTSRYRRREWGSKRRLIEVGQMHICVRREVGDTTNLRLHENGGTVPKHF